MKPIKTEPPKFTPFKCYYVTKETQRQVEVLCKKFNENPSKVITRLITERYASMFVDYSGDLK